MRGRLLRWIALTALVQSLLAIGSYGLTLAAERSNLGVFSNLERALVFVDVSGYFTHADRTFAGQIPYRDDAIEYPILSLPFLYAPRLLTRSQGVFVALFACEMLAFNSLLIAVVAARVARTDGIGAVRSRLAWLTLFFACVGPFVIGRYDVVPAFLGFAAACAWFGGRPGAGGFLAAVGTLVKVAPGAVGMIGILKEVGALLGAGWGGPKPGFRRFPSGTFAFLMTLVIGVVAWLWVGRDGVLQSLRYHSERGIEIGSLASGLLWCDGMATGSSFEILYDHQSLNLVTPRSAAWAKGAILFQAGLMVVVGLVFLRGRGRDPLRFAGAAVLTFVLGGKVLSPQYLIWLMPFAASIGGKAGRASRLLFLAASVLTAILYPWGAGGLRDLENWAFVVLNVRNLALVSVFACWLGLPSGEDSGAVAISDASAVP